MGKSKWEFLQGRSIVVGKKLLAWGNKREIRGKKKKKKTKKKKGLKINRGGVDVK